MAFGATGNTFGAQTTSADVSDESDRELLLSARRLSDVALTGGETARREGYRGSSTLAIAILTRDPESVAEVPAVGQPGAKGTHIYTTNNDTVAALNTAVGDLRAKGMHKILFEGGENLLSAAIRTGLIDEVLASCVSGPGEVPLLAALIQSGWTVSDAANFGSRWLFKLAKPQR